MPRPNAFYYKETGEAITFSDEAGGELDVGELTQGRDYWKQYANATIGKKPKLLLLVDWTAPGWSRDEIARAQISCRTLLDEGFPLYVWQNGDVVPLTKETLSLLKEQQIRDRITPVFPEEAKQECVHQHRQFTLDQIHLLDPNEMYYLEHGEYCPQRIFAMVPGIHRFKQFELMELIQREEPASTLIWPRVLGLNSKNHILWDTNFTNKVFARNKKTKRKVGLEYVALCSDLKHIKTFISFIKRGLINMQHIYLDAHGMQEEIMAQLIMPSFKLKSLYLENITKEQLLFITQKTDCSALQTFGLANCSEIDWDELQQIIFSKTLPLKRLKIEQCDKIILDFSTSTSLHALEILTVINNKINLDSLNALPLLEELTLTSLTEDKLTDTLILPHLKSLTLEGAFFLNSQKTYALLGHSLGLKYFSILENKHLEQGFSQQLTNFQGLEELNFKKSHIHIDDLRHFLRACKHIRKFNLYNTQIENLQSGFTHGLDFSQLHELNVGFSNVSMMDLIYIAKQTDKLEHLILGDLILSDDFINNLSVSRLEKLDLFYTKITPDALITLLSQCNKLRILDLSYQKKLPRNFTQKLSLPRLEYLLIDHANLSFDDFEHLTAGAPYLSYISQSLSPELASNPQTMSIIKKINRYAPVSSSDTNPPNEFDLNSFLFNKPQTKPFVFYGHNTLLNQTMVIEKLSQYLTLMNKHLSFLQKLQNGICVAMSHLFLACNEEKWTALLSCLQQWDGQIEHITNELTQYMDFIWFYMEQYQLSQSKTSFIGDKLTEYLKQHSQNMILGNGWHAISLKYQEANQWLLYDPNFVDGKGLLRHTHELEPVIIKQLGRLINTINIDNSWKPTVADQSAFIQHGGLLKLITSNNMDELIQTINPDNIQPQALSGLLLRFNNGEPAWVSTLFDNKTQHIALSLLALLIRHYPQQYKIMLQNSLDVLDLDKRQKLITELRSIREKDSIVIDKLCTVLQRSPQKQQFFAKQFETWTHQVPSANTVMDLCQQLLHEQAKKRLVELKSSSDIQAMQCLLQKYAQDHGLEYVLITSPRDLVCSADYIKRQGNHGVLTQGPGGFLHDFLITTPSPILIINYDKFTHGDLARFNKLLNGDADGTPLPETTILIGLINPDKSNFSLDDDFYSGFDDRHQCPFQGASLTEYLPPMPKIITETDEQAATIIDLYHAKNWKTRLAGQWILKDNQLFYEEGLLIPAMAQCTTIIIQNGHWDDPDFVAFWQQAQYIRRIVHEGLVINIPNDMIFYQRNGYNWSYLTENIRFETGLKAEATVLNPGLLQNCFNHYHCNNDTHALTFIPGLLAEQPIGSEWHINITRSLNTDEWAMLLHGCRQRALSLHCHIAPGVSLPEELPSLTHVSIQPEPWDYHINTPVLIIHSIDCDSTALMITQNEQAWVEININECKSSDLLIYLESKYTSGQEFPFHFTEHERALLVALKAGKNVLLKGTFKAELVDALTPIILNPLTSGRLVLLSTDMRYLNFHHSVTHQVDEECKRVCLLHHGFASTELEYLSSDQLQHEPLSRLISRLEFIRINPGQNSDRSWRGLDGEQPHFESIICDFEHSKEIAMAFNSKRLHAVNTILDNSPYVFLTGLTAVGKTSFVEQVFIQEEDILFYSERSIECWAQDNSDKRKILFIDEANLSSRQWSEFEGLFNKQPGILVNGHYYLLNRQHKIVFAGNPLNYGAGRTLANFFKRHGKAIVFEPMPVEFIYGVILKPVFDNTLLEDKTVVIAAPLLDVYNYLCKCSSTELLISPRELQMMALLTLLAIEKQPSQNPHTVARYYAFELAKALVPLHYHREFTQRYEAVMPHDASFLFSDNYAPITGSRQNAIKQLDDLLALYQRRQKISGNNAQQYGGLNGIILESNSPETCIELIIACLRMHHFKSGSLHDDNSECNNTFYHLSTSMQLTDKKKLLLKAFDEGAVVLIEDANRSPMMERYLNALLMGKNPEAGDNQSIHPKKPGFMIIGIQDSPTKANRLKPSNALARRLITTTLPDYSTKELQTILIVKGVESVDAKNMIAGWQNKVTEAKQYQYKPAPGLNDLWRIARKTICSTECVNSEPPHQQAHILITDEIKRLLRMDKANSKASVPKLNQIKIRALEELVNQITPDHYKMSNALHDWLMIYREDLNRNTNPIQTFYKPEQRSPTQKLVAKLCELYPINELVTIPASSI